MHYSKSASANPPELWVHGEMHAGIEEGGVVPVEPGQKNAQRRWIAEEQLKGILYEAARIPVDSCRAPAQTPPGPGVNENALITARGAKCLLSHLCLACRPVQD